MKTDWFNWLEQQKQQPYLRETLDYVATKRHEGVSIFPPQDAVFSAFESTPLTEVKVVILGQDPYHGPNQAHGLCFSVLPEVKIPPSLKNIYKELVTDIEGFEAPQHGYLQSWAAQGVLMLNAVLTVEQGKANSHRKLGWEQLTDNAIEHINRQCEGVVFMLWGSPAQKKGSHIDTQRHHVLKAPHPSPLAAYRGFFGCGHFSKANELLVEQGKTTINWQV